MAEALRSTLQTKLDTSDVHDLDIPSNDLFRPQLQQIGRSLHEIKEHFICNNSVSVVPTSLETPLNEIKRHILKLIEKNDELRRYDFLIKRRLNVSKSENSKAFIFLTKSLPVALDFDVTQGHPDGILCDVFILLPKQPAVILTVTHGDSTTDYDKEKNYNMAVARGVCMSLGRYLDIGFKTATGVVTYQDLVNESRFKTRVLDIIENSGRFVTYRSLSMDAMKYEKVLTAFWASISETKSVVTREEGTSNSVRFLTKDQCVVLVENMNKDKVEVSSASRTGSTVLMAEAARRLSHIGNTLFVCEKEEDRENYRRILSGVKICSSTDLERSCDLALYKCVVDEVPEKTRILARKPVKGIHWVRYLKPDNEDSAGSRSVQIEKRQNQCDDELTSPSKRRRLVAQMDRLTLDVNVLRMEEEMASGMMLTSISTNETQEQTGKEGSVLSFTADTEGRKVTVLYPSMELDKELVNTKHCHINDSGELVNRPLKGGAKTGYKRYWGTTSTRHIPVSSLNIHYWEVHAEIEPKGLGEEASSRPEITWGPVLEFGVVGESQVDERVWISQNKRFWCLCVDGCKKREHFGRYCTHIRREDRKEESIPCYTENITNTGKTSLKYGIIVDVDRKSVGFIDVEKEDVIETIMADFDETLLPMFGVKHIAKNNFNIKLKLVSGKLLDMTEKKRSLIIMSLQKQKVNIPE